MIKKGVRLSVISTNLKGYKCNLLFFYCLGVHVIVLRIARFNMIQQASYSYHMLS